MKKQEYEITGSYNPETGEINKEYTGNGFVYKNPNAFYSKSKEVCYIPELMDDKFTYADFLEIAEGNEKLAEHLFDTVDWQSPHTLMSEIDIDEYEEENGR